MKIYSGDKKGAVVCTETDFYQVRKITSLSRTDLFENWILGRFMSGFIGSLKACCIFCLLLLFFFLEFHCKSSWLNAEKSSLNIYSRKSLMHITMVLQKMQRFCCCYIMYLIWAKSSNELLEQCRFKHVHTCFETYRKSVHQVLCWPRQTQRLYNFTMHIKLSWSPLAIEPLFTDQTRPVKLFRLDRKNAKCECWKSRKPCAKYNGERNNVERNVGKKCI